MADMTILMTWWLTMDVAMWDGRVAGFNLVLGDRIRCCLAEVELLTSGGYGNDNG
jgi:hypothetical protein